MKCCILFISVQLLVVKLDHSSHPYVIVGITTFLYKLADTFGFSPHGLTPVFARLKNEFLPFIQASKGSNLYILFAITAAGVVPCGGRKKSPRTSSIVQIIFLFRSFEISKDIQGVQNTHV